MGSRAVLHVYDGRQHVRYYLHWGSPEYQVPNLATAVHEVLGKGLPLNVHAYEQYAMGLDEGALPTERRGGIRDATYAMAVGAWDWDYRNRGDLENLYRLYAADGRFSELLAMSWSYLWSQWEERSHAIDLPGLYREAAGMTRRRVKLTQQHMDRNDGNLPSGYPTPEVLEDIARGYDAWHLALRPTHDPDS